MRRARRQEGPDHGVLICSIQKFGCLRSFGSHYGGLNRQVTSDSLFFFFFKEYVDGGIQDGLEEAGKLDAAMPVRGPSYKPEW